MGGSMFFNDTATTEICTLSLHDALPIYLEQTIDRMRGKVGSTVKLTLARPPETAPLDFSLTRANVRVSSVKSQDRKSTRLNSSHANISYAVFCLKKKIRYTLVRAKTQQE